jgi:hypothetical protein
MYGLSALYLRRCSRGAEPAKLDRQQLVHRIKLKLEVLKSRIMLVLDLFNELVELRPVSSDLLFQQTGTVLQIPADITHCLPPKRKDVRMTERADRFTQDQMSCRPPRSARRHWNPSKLPRPGSRPAD